jgi:hypothetical protein
MLSPLDRQDKSSGGMPPQASEQTDWPHFSQISPLYAWVDLPEAWAPHPAYIAHRITEPQSPSHRIKAKDQTTWWGKAQEKLEESTKPWALNSRP